MPGTYKNKKIAGRQMLEHRFVVEQALGRKLYGRREQVHHIDGDKQNNALSNLEVLSPKEHAAKHLWKHSPTKACQVCGHTFTPHPTKRERAKTCSKVCRYALLSLKNRKPTAPCSIYRAAPPSVIACRKPQVAQVFIEAYLSSVGE